MNSIRKTAIIDERPSSSFVRGVADGVPTLLGYVSIAFAAGMVGAATHLSILENALLAALVYAGASQFIICAMLAAASPMSAIIFTTFIVNVRHFLMCSTLAPHLKAYSLGKNIGIGALVTDETFAVAMNKIGRGGKIDDRWMNGLNLSAYIVWVLSTAAGAMLGKWISDPQRLGLDFALTAMFVALMILQLQSVKRSVLKHHLVLVFCTIVIMTGLSFFMSSYLAVVLSTMIAATIGVLTER